MGEKADAALNTVGNRRLDQGAYVLIAASVVGVVHLLQTLGKDELERCECKNGRKIASK